MERQPAARRLRPRADRRPSARRSASCRPPRATPITTSCASTARSRRRSASPRTCRCSGATRAPGSAATSRRTCSRRTSSTSAAAASSRCSACGARTASTRCCASAGCAGIVLCGLSAGSLCWFAEAVTAFHGPPQRVPRPRPAAVLELRALRRRAGAARELPPASSAEGMAPGYAASDGAALHFRGESLAGVVSSRPQATACWVEEVGGDISEVALPVRWLGESRTLTAA